MYTFRIKKKHKLEKKKKNTNWYISNPPRRPNSTIEIVAQSKFNFHKITLIDINLYIIRLIVVYITMNYYDIMNTKLHNNTSLPSDLSDKIHRTS